VVLPFFADNLSLSDRSNFEFVGAEITNCLAKIQDYHVMGWEESRKYERGEKKYSEIGDDLSAALLVDWKPYVNSKPKHLSVNLISASDGDMLWGENFKIEGDWPTEICKHSRKISKKITRKLRTYLTPQERAILSEQPVSAQATLFASLGIAMTQDAREMIYIGNGYGDTTKSEYIDSISFDKAIQYFTDAINEDPSFAAAYANRAKAHLWGFDVGYYDRSVIAECEKDIRKAFELQPNLPEAHVAMGFYYYYGIEEYKWALISFEKAVELRPYNYEYLFNLSIIWRVLGNWEMVQLFSDIVFTSNPQNVLFLTNLGLSYLYLREFRKSIECQDRAIELNPQWYAPYINKMNALTSLGEISKARSVVNEAKKRTDKKYYRMEAQLDLYEGKYSSAIENIEKAGIQEYKYLTETEGDTYLLKAKIYKHSGNLRLAQENYQRAADYFNNAIMFNPEDYPAYSNLGVAYAGLGLNHQAIEMGQKAHELISQQNNKRVIHFTLYDIIQIYAITGDKETALTIIEELLNTPSSYTLDLLRLDPDIQPILDEPES